MRAPSSLPPLLSLLLLVPPQSRAPWKPDGRVVPAGDSRQSDVEQPTHEALPQGTQASGRLERPSASPCPQVLRPLPSGWREQSP